MISTSPSFAPPEPVRLQLRNMPNIRAFMGHGTQAAENSVSSRIHAIVFA
jgi:hypothetical protein